MFRENIFDSGNFCHPQTEAFLAVLQVGCPLAEPDKQQSCGSQGLLQSWACGRSGGTRKNGTEEFQSTTHPRSSPGAAAEMPLTPLNFRLGSHLLRHHPQWACLLHMASEEVENNLLSFPEQNIFRISFPQERWNFFRLCYNPEQKLSGNVRISHRKKMPRFHSH